jgi:hypothetical protein
MDQWLTPLIHAGASCPGREALNKSALPEQMLKIPSLEFFQFAAARYTSALQRMIFFSSRSIRGGRAGGPRRQYATENFCHG